jgi:hypothetical protein
MKTSNTVNPTSVTIAPAAPAAPASWDSAADMVNLMLVGCSAYQSVHNWVVSLTSVNALNLFNPQHCKTADKIAEHAKVLGISVSKLKHLCAFRADFDARAIEKGIVSRATWQTMKACSPEGKAKKAEKNAKAHAKKKGLADIGKGKATKSKKDEIKSDLTSLVKSSLQNARVFLSQIMAGIEAHEPTPRNLKVIQMLRDSCELLSK